MKSGQQIAQDNIIKFHDWVTERRAVDDWKDYLRSGKLNRSEIAAECGFALSVLRQNPAVKKALHDLEEDLMARGTIPSLKAAHGASNESKDASARATDKRVMATLARAEARVKVLEEQNAVLKAEVRDLREKQRRFEQLGDHLGMTGRLLPA
jgi:uncharacterized protein involved in exopolysaccharide biosynthesis